MSILQAWLTNEAFINLLVVLFGLALTAIKGMDWYKQHLQGKYDKSVDCVSAAIVAVANDYSANLKKANADGKLTDEEKTEAKNKAIELAKALGQKQGVDIIKVVGEDFIDSLIAKKVNELK